MTPDEVIYNLKKLALKLRQKKYITLKDIGTVPGLEYYTYYHFKRLANALRAAGLPSSKLASSMNIKSEDLLNYLRDLRNELGHNPTMYDIYRDEKIFKKYSETKISWAILRTRFNGLRNALEQLNDKQKDDKKTLSKGINREYSKFFQNTNRFYGEGAELHVTAELLYHEFQAANIPVDEGLDILAVKNNKTFYFQVKHKDLNSNNPIKLTRSSFERNGGGSVYYIFVLLSEKKRDFLILPYHIVNDWIREKLAEEQEKEYLIQIKKEGEEYKFKNIILNKYLDGWENIR